MKLEQFLRHKTQCYELCVIRDSGWIIATFWIDDEDLFCGKIHPHLDDAEVVKEFWDDLTIVDENDKKVKIPCHIIDVEFKDTWRILQVPAWCHIGEWIEWHNPKITGMQWAKERIIGYGDGGFYHQAHNCPVYFTKWSECEGTIREVEE
jgi:hypothetical protein